VTAPARLGRRRFLQGAAATGLLAVAGCGTATKSARSSTTTARSSASTSTPAPPTTTAATTTATDADWARLAHTLSGSLVRPDQAGYATDHELFDFRYDSIDPAGIAYCATPDDVARSIGFARQHGIVPTPRAGGHSYAGYSTSGGLVVDVTRMATVTPPVSGSTIAAVGAGARLIDVYTALNAKGVSIPAGSCPTVGITGLTLGGGIGVVCRQYGLTSDRVVSATVVTADSRIVTASADTNPDLYWALRGGGGGNFGVVTGWEFDTFAVPDATVVFTYTWPWSAAADVLSAWQGWVRTMPDQLWSNCIFEAKPGQSQALVQVSGVYLGSQSAATGLLARLTAAAGQATTSYTAPVAFSNAMYIEAGCSNLTQAECHLPTQNPAGQLSRAPSIAKSELLTTPLAAAGITALVDAVGSGQGSGLPGAVAFDAMGGATTRPAADATAWVHRDCELGIQYSVPLVSSDSATVIDGYRSWLDSIYKAIRPLVSGQSYQNYIDPDLPDWAQAYYGANLPRLERVRQQWDSDATFHFAQAIPRA
jgi:FAD binding domain/Berberine and berberine like